MITRLPAGLQTRRIFRQPAAIFTIGNKSTYIDVGGVLYTDVSGDTFLFPPAIILCLIL